LVNLSEGKDVFIEKQDAKMTEYSDLCTKSAKNLWNEDVNVFMELLHAAEEKEKISAKVTPKLQNKAEEGASQVKKISKRKRYPS
jgi:SH3-like domain-containing protein